MKNVSDLDTGHVDIIGKPISLLDEVITYSKGSYKGINKMIVIRSTAKGVRVCSADRLIGYFPTGEVREATNVYVIGPFVPPDIQFIHNVDNTYLKLFMLRAWKLRNNIGVI